MPTNQLRGNVLCCVVQHIYGCTGKVLVLSPRSENRTVWTKPRDGLQPFSKRVGCPDGVGSKYRYERDADGLACSGCEPGSECRWKCMRADAGLVGCETRDGVCV
jgi:hypothetical protein